MAQRQALVRRAVTVENIGRVTYICSDKTGTITEGRLRLEHLLPARPHRRGPVALPRVASRPEARAATRWTRRSSGGRGEGDRRRSPRDARDLSLHRGPQAGDGDRTRRTMGGLLVVTKGAAEVVLAMSTPDDAESDYLARRDREARRRGPQGDRGRVPRGRRRAGIRRESRTRASSSRVCWRSRIRSAKESGRGPRLQGRRDPPHHGHRRSSDDGPRRREERRHRRREPRV